MKSLRNSKLELKFILESLISLPLINTFQQNYNFKSLQGFDDHDHLKGLKFFISFYFFDTFQF